MLESIWFVLWGVLWAVYFMLDGFDLGMGALSPFLSKSDEDRRLIYNAMGPYWDGNEVWLITAGGVTFAAFPTAYAVMFSSFYSALLLILFCLIVRGVSFEFRGKVDNPTWRKVWDWCLFLGSALPAFLFGVAFANIFKGIAIDTAGVHHAYLISLLNPYGLIGGGFFLFLFCMHGALWLAVKTTGEMQQKAGRAAQTLWPIVLAFAIIFVGSSVFATNLFANYVNALILFLVPMIAVIALLGSRLFMADKGWLKAWTCSSVTIVCCTLFGVIGLYPNLLPSSLDPQASLTIHNAASSPLTLKIMLGVALVMVPIVIAYQAYVYYHFRGAVTLESLLDEEAY